MTRKDNPLGAFLLTLALLAGTLVSHGSLMASGEEELLKDAAAIAAASPLEPQFQELSDEPIPAPSAAVSGTVTAKTTADLAISRAISFMMAHGSLEEAQKVIDMLAQGTITVGVGGPQSNLRIPESLVLMDAKETKNPALGVRRTVGLARALLFGLYSRPTREGIEPAPVETWTRTLDALSAWVRYGTKAVEQSANMDVESRRAASKHALTIVEEMRRAIREYRAAGWHGDPRIEAWMTVYTGLGKVRDLLKNKIEPAD